jgi:hypothetical protein
MMPAELSIDLLRTAMESLLRPRPLLKPWLDEKRGVIERILSIIDADRTSSGPHIVTASVAAEILGVSRQRVHQLAQEGRLTPIDVAVGGKERERMILFERTDIELCRRERAEKK